jgi:hypothetical protein
MVQAQEPWDQIKVPAIARDGEVVEWLKAPHSKCGILARVSWVRIPPSPPTSANGSMQAFELYKYSGIEVGVIPHDMPRLTIVG